MRSLLSKRFAKNRDHGFSRNAVLRSIVVRAPPLADGSGQRRNASFRQSMYNRRKKESAGHQWAWSMQTGYHTEKGRRDAPADHSLQSRNKPPYLIATRTYSRFATLVLDWPYGDQGINTPASPERSQGRKPTGQEVRKLVKILSVRTNMRYNGYSRRYHSRSVHSSF